METLGREHRIVEQVCEACRHELDRAAETNDLDPVEVERFVGFFRFFANTCHDPKEEDLLFTMLHRRGLSWDEHPLADLVREPEEMRVILDAADGWVPHLMLGNRAPRAPSAATCSTTPTWCRRTSPKGGIFVIALEMPSKADHDELTLAFENVVCDEGDEGLHQGCKDLARELASYSAA